MTSALRWAVMRAILMFHNCEGQSHRTVSTDHNFWRERRTEADSNRGPSAYQPNALPLGQTGSLSLSPCFSWNSVNNNNNITLVWSPTPECDQVWSSPLLYVCFMCPEYGMVGMNGLITILVWSLHWVINSWMWSSLVFSLSAHFSWNIVNNNNKNYW